MVFFFGSPLANGNGPSTGGAITTYSGSQDAEGFTYKDMDMDYLEAARKLSLDRFSHHVRRFLKETLGNDNGVTFRANAVYFGRDMKKVALVRLESILDGKVFGNQIFAFWIRGRELLKVVCTTDTAEAISISRGACSEEMHNTFGFYLK